MVWLLAWASQAWGAASAEDKVLARQHFEAGARHFDLSEWDQALVEFKEAYRLKPDAIFLYNIAQCHRKLGNIEDALTFYRTYLRRSPAASNRDEVERRIAELEAERQARQAKQVEEERARKARAEQEAQAGALPAAPLPGPSLPPGAAPSVGVPMAAGVSVGQVQLAPSAPSTAPAQTSIFARWWFWTAVAAVVVVGVTAGVLLSRGGGSQTFCPDCATTAGVNLQ